MGKYEEIGAEIGRLVDEKNLKYGASFDKTGDLLRIICPEGIGADQYDDVLFFARMSDKIFRVFTDKDAFSESPYRDMAGYCLLAAARVEEKQKMAHPDNRQTTMDMWDEDFEPEIFTEFEKSRVSEAYVREIVKMMQRTGMI